jgi:hypothetical protein
VVDPQEKASAGPALTEPRDAEWRDARAELDVLTGVVTQPMHWPAVPPDRLAEEFKALRAWVEHLVGRFSLDSHVVPACWWRHNHLVEALAALRDHERASYARISPATGPVEFHRAFRDIDALLRSWVAELRCEAGHDASHDSPRRVPAEGWDEWLSAETERRRAEPAPGPGPGAVEKSPPRPQ